MSAPDERIVARNTIPPIGVLLLILAVAFVSAIVVTSL